MIGASEKTASCHLYHLKAPIFQMCFETCLFWRFICKLREILVPLQCQMRKVETPPIKDKNCED